MRGKHLRNIRNHVGKNGGGATQCAVNPLLLDFMSGDIVWVKIHNSSWWPAQVVDEKTVPEGHITNKKMADEVLVRLYGGYDFLYVDPTKYYSEFENILKHNNGNFREIIKKALKQDLAQLEYDAELKEEVSESKDEAGVVASNDKQPEEDQIKIKKKCEVDNVGSANAVCRKPKQDGIKENHKLNGLGSRGASSREPGDVSSPRTRAMKRNLSAGESVGEEASTVITPKQNQVNENHWIDSPIIDLSEMKSLVKLKAGVSGSKDKARVEASKVEQAKKDGKTKKNRKSKDDQAKEDGKIMKNCKSKDKRPKNDGIKMKKNHEADNPGSVSMVCKKSKQDGIKEKQEMNGLSPCGGSLGKPQDVSAPRTRVLKRHLSLDKSVVEEAPKAKTPKKNRVIEHHKADSPSIEKGSLETPQDTSLRRTRVMQNLGLIAPRGSPFLRNGL